MCLDVHLLKFGVMDVNIFIITVNFIKIEKVNLR